MEKTRHLKRSPLSGNCDGHFFQQQHKWFLEYSKKKKSLLMKKIFCRSSGLNIMGGCLHWQSEHYWQRQVNFLFSSTNLNQKQSACELYSTKINKYKHFLFKPASMQCVTWQIRNVLPTKTWQPTNPEYSKKGFSARKIILRPATNIKLKKKIPMSNILNIHCLHTLHISAVFIFAQSKVYLIVTAAVRPFVAT